MIGTSNNDGHELTLLEINCYNCIDLQNFATTTYKLFDIYNWITITCFHRTSRNYCNDECSCHSFRTLWPTIYILVILCFNKSEKEKSIKRAYGYIIIKYKFVVVCQLSIKCVWHMFANMDVYLSIILNLFIHFVWSRFKFQLHDLLIKNVRLY